MVFMPSTLDQDLRGQIEGLRGQIKGLRGQISGRRPTDPPTYRRTNLPQTDIAECSRVARDLKNITRNKRALYEKFSSRLCGNILERFYFDTLLFFVRIIHASNSLPTMHRQHLWPTVPNSDKQWRAPIASNCS